MDKNLTIKFSHSYEGDWIFEGTWKGEAFKALFVTTDIDYGWHPLSYLPDYDINDFEDGIGEGVLNDYNEDEYDDILEALSDLNLHMEVLIN